MKTAFYKTILAAALASSVFLMPAQASVTISSTRIIFPSQEREVTIRLSNEGTSPALVQTWLDKGVASESPDKIDVPFTLTPTMFRLDPQKGQALRLIYTQEPLAQDKETLFWLNVLEIPPKLKTDGADTAQLQFALRTRIKVFFRPKELKGNASDSPSKVTWELTQTSDGKGYALKANNPTPYFVNFSNLELKAGEEKFDAGSGYIKPGETEIFPVANLNARPDQGTEVHYSAINDFGGSTKDHSSVK